MRVIAENYDYYDRFSDKESRVVYKRCGQEFGDRTPGFLSGIEINVPHTKPFVASSHWRKEVLLKYTLEGAKFSNKWIDHSSVKYFWLLIAGKLYPGITLGVCHAATPNDKCVLHRLYSAKAVLKLLTTKAVFKGHVKKSLLTLKQVAAELRFYFSATISFEKACKIHLHYKSPIIALQANGHTAKVCAVMVDPELKAIGFHKHLNPFLLFQEVSQFMGSTMVIEKNVPSKSSDLDKVQQHGFDKKTSFRKM